MPYFSLTSCLPTKRHVDETEQLTKEIKRLLMDPEWTAEASAAPGEVTNKAHCCGTAAMYVEFAVGSHWRQEKVVKDAINKHTAVENCYLLKAKHITQEMDPNTLTMYVCVRAAAAFLRMASLLAQTCRP